MAKMATRAELSAIIIELYNELKNIKSLLTELIDDETNEKVRKLALAKRNEYR